MEEAESLMQRAVRLYPDSRQLQFQLGELYVTWGKYQKAIEAFQEAARRGRPIGPRSGATTTRPDLRKDRGDEFLPGPV